jgi:GntR family transcriptional regulator
VIPAACMNVASPISWATSASQVACSREVSSRGSPSPPASDRISGVVMFRRPGSVPPQTSPAEMPCRVARVSVHPEALRAVCLRQRTRRAGGALEADAEGIAPRRRTRLTIRVGQAVRPTRVRHTGHTGYPAWPDTVCLVHHVDHMDPTPLYVQLASILRGLITSGELQPRAPLPSESYLQQEQGVSRGTVRMAVAILRDEGLVVTIGGRGTFVSPRDK